MGASCLHTTPHTPRDRQCGVLLRFCRRGDLTGGLVAGRVGGHAKRGVRSNRPHPQLPAVTDWLTPCMSSTSVWSPVLVPSGTDPAGETLWGKGMNTTLEKSLSKLLSLLLLWLLSSLLLLSLLLLSSSSLLSLSLLLFHWTFWIEISWWRLNPNFFIESSLNPSVCEEVNSVTSAKGLWRIRPETVKQTKILSNTYFSNSIWTNALWYFRKKSNKRKNFAGIPKQKWLLSNVDSRSPLRDLAELPKRHNAWYHCVPLL